MKTVERWVGGCSVKNALAGRVCIQAWVLLSTADLEHLRMNGMYTFLDLEQALAECSGTKPERLDERTWAIIERYHEHRCKRQEDAQRHIAEQTVDRFLGRAA